MRQNRQVDGFRLAYERTGPGGGRPAVLLLHGWPGDRTDYREVVPLLPGADVMVPTYGASANPTSMVPTTVLWPSHDPLFPREWSDRIGEFFAAARMSLLDGVGQFSPLESPRDFAAAVAAAAGSARITPGEPPASDAPPRP